MRYIVALFYTLPFYFSCSVQSPLQEPTSVPYPPDYSKSSNWAALPTEKDNADRTPGPELADFQQEAEADVFFFHPTIYWQKNAKPLNASLNDAKLNEKVDETTILFQASAFNKAGKIYAPRYRQAHLRCFFMKNKSAANAALNLAYEDLKAAFAYYLEHYNQGRPVIIASHSQGTRHAYRLMQEVFDGKPLQEKLVAAYLVGWPVPANSFENIPPCETPKQTGCICSWRSFRHGYTPENYMLGDSIIVTNPLTWTTDKMPASKELNKGTILRKFTKIYPQIADAQIHNGMLWVHKPKFPGSLFFTRRNYHIADYNLFYMNIRDNARIRVEAFRR